MVPCGEVDGSLVWYFGGSAWVLIDVYGELPLQGFGGVSS